MKRKELINRWNLPEGISLLRDILIALKQNRPLNEVTGIGKIDSRIDLRGARLSTVKDQRTIGTKEHSLTQKFGSLKVKNAELKDIDFSNCDISYGLFQECRFTNCLFHETTAREVEIYAADFENCLFEKTNFSYAFMNNNIGSNAGSFRNCRFLGADLQEASFSFPIIDNCIFEGCRLNGTDFDGSRMRNVRFIGEVDSPFFRGHSWTAQKSLYWIFNRVNPKDYPNRMDNVDFSMANLKDVLFLDDIDLSQCKLPKSGDFIIVKNIHEVFPKLRDFISKNWHGEDKRQALFLIDNLYYGPKKQGMTLDVISTIPSEHLGRDLQESLDRLINEYNGNR